MTLLTHLRSLIDRYEWGPVIASLIVALTPILVILVLITGAPWWFIPAIAGVLVLIGAWIGLVIAAMTKWWER